MGHGCIELKVRVERLSSLEDTQKTIGIDTGQGLKQKLVPQHWPSLLQLQSQSQSVPVSPSPIPMSILSWACSRCELYIVSYSRDREGDEDRLMIRCVMG